MTLQNNSQKTCMYGNDQNKKENRMFLLLPTLYQVSANLSEFYLYLTPRNEKPKTFKKTPSRKTTYMYRYIAYMSKMLNKVHKYLK